MVKQKQNANPPIAFLGLLILDAHNNFLQRLYLCWIYLKDISRWTCLLNKAKSLGSSIVDCTVDERDHLRLRFWRAVQSSHALVPRLVGLATPGWNCCRLHHLLVSLQPPLGCFTVFLWWRCLALRSRQGKSPVFCIVDGPWANIRVGILDW